MPADPDATQRITDAAFDAAFVAGQRVFDRYVLEVEIGRGGMGVVWRARDDVLGEAVALKFLPAAVARDAVAVDELKEETRRARRLTHVNIVRIHDFVQGGAGAAIAMELVEGATLAQLRLQQPGKIFSAAALAPLVPQLCAALDYAHTHAKVAHRDLKPANILVTPDGTAKIADFGIARSLTETQTRLTGTTKGTSGTLLYMSPQQLRGQRATPADDIYALGAMLYELLAGKPPFYTGDLFNLVLQAEPPSLAERRAELGIEGEPIASEWERTILACLEKDPTHRPASAGEVAERLQGATLDGDKTKIIPAGVVASRATRSAKLRATKGRFGLYTALVAAAVLIIAAVVFWPRAQPVGRIIPNPPKSDGASGITRRTELPEGWTLVEPPESSVAVKSKKLAEERPSMAPVVPVLLREFTVTVDPPDAGAHLWLGPQSDVAVPAGGRALVKDLSDGEHELIVQATGYQPFTTRVTVKDGRGSVEAKLVAVKGAFTLKARAGTVVTAVDARGKETRVGSVPPGGTLSSDNLLTIGTYLFKFTHADCAEARQENVELALSRPAALAPAQVTLPGELRIFTVPTGAEVSVNGKRLGATPATLKNQPSETPLAVEVFARGYRRVEQRVALKPAEVRTVNLGTLVAESGGVELRMTNGELRMENVAVAIDGRSAALQPAPSEVGRVIPAPAGKSNAPSSAERRIKDNPPYLIEGLEVGTRTIEISHPDYEPWRQSVTVRDQQNTPVEVALKPKPGRLAIRAEPRTIGLTVNGRAVQPAEIVNGEIALPAGEALALVASARGYKSATHTVTLPANGADRWDVILEKLRGPEVGQAWTIPDLGLTMQPITAGTFRMGDEGQYGGRPYTQVTLTRPYWLGKTEVTQREWTAVMGNNPSGFKGDNLPVENVSWNDAMQFCRKLTERERAADRLPEGHAYTLPTEAQWEYACRSGTTGDYAGNLDAMGWYASNSGSTTHPVGQKQANAWGLYDMHGNVWEWCADWFADKLPGGAVRDPAGPASGSARVGRGGGWSGAAVGCRSANRNRDGPGNRLYYLGFRLALSSVP